MFNLGSVASLGDSGPLSHLLVGLVSLSRQSVRRSLGGGIMWLLASRRVDDGGREADLERGFERSF